MLNEYNVLDLDYSLTISMRDRNLEVSISLFNRNAILNHSARVISLLKKDFTY